MARDSVEPLLFSGECNFPFNTSSIDTVDPLSVGDIPAVFHATVEVTGDHYSLIWLQELVKSLELFSVTILSMGLPCLPLPKKRELHVK